MKTLKLYFVIVFTIFLFAGCSTQVNNIKVMDNYHEQLTHVEIQWNKPESYSVEFVVGTRSYNPTFSEKRHKASQEALKNLGKLNKILKEEVVIQLKKKLTQNNIIVDTDGPIILAMAPIFYSANKIEINVKLLNKKSEKPLWIADISVPLRNSFLSMIPFASLLEDKNRVVNSVVETVLKTLIKWKYLPENITID